MKKIEKIILEMRDIRKVYKTGTEIFAALRGITIKITKGEFIAIMGPSGSGKSTLLHILGCLDNPTDGDYLLDGISIKDFKADELARIRNQNIGFVFQDYSRAILPRFSVKDNVLVPLIYSNQSGRNWHDKVLEKLKIVGMEDKVTAYPPQLSGGEKQRVAIARALINDPIVLLADEPTGNLDSWKSREIMELFKNLNNHGMTIVIITHEDDIADYAARQVLIKDGAIIRDEAR